MIKYELFPSSTHYLLEGVRIATRSLRAATISDLQKLGKGNQGLKAENATTEL